MRPALVQWLLNIFLKLLNINVSSITELFVYPHSTLSFSVLLTGIVGEAVSNRVLSQKYTVEETDVQVRPELLPSALLDCRVKFLKLKKCFSKDAWALLTSSGQWYFF